MPRSVPGPCGDRQIKRHTGNPQQPSPVTTYGLTHATCFYLRASGNTLAPNGPPQSQLYLFFRF
ncbi:hypothetical protein PISMIDRAFT_687729 [Pisolithus microcarpus 441]|uniref:Uncharacterized protein n=1 Tax=Pisolithus microcarpus 441 TaxID=765257 RepID=A0A0C9Z3Z9_9AGAM|nr:hypothetical protein PISMIDRAFT_687729 [Pisolithus microcarpus 441]